ncbi:Fc receptor-like protein 1 isoform X4 [Moschus berezovskii]|uniref:Fc receptor-like protein 1 isoform X4 n=1 Tax=Moschus berezovskii TaxID=68408 RepID=UPI002443D2B6|nr:Fc receptor-like protein 1 isoform X4 [Moschus berezovskii]
MLLRLLLLICAPLCESTELFLIVSPSRPIEGNTMTLTCKTQPPPQKLDTKLQFRFYRDGRALGLDWDSLPDFQIPAVRKEDSGSYWCQAKITSIKAKLSRRVQIEVHRVPIGNVSLEIQPPGGHLMEGEKLVLVCLVTGGTGDIVFFWFRGARGVSLKTKTQHSPVATFEIAAVRESDSDRYYCAADNGYGPSLSELVSVTVKIPVSRPTLSLGAPGARLLVGHTVELHCEARSGSPPILYQFYHEDVPLGNSSAPFGGGVSFNLSLTAEDSGNYYCEANNGQVAQRSEAVPLNVTVPMEDRNEVLTSAVIELLLGILAPTTLALLFCCWLKRKIGRRTAKDAVRNVPSPVPQESTYFNSQAPEQLHPDYENVNIVSGDEVYSLVYCVQQERPSAAESPSGTHPGDKDPSAIYSRLKKADFTDMDYDDVM